MPVVTEQEVKDHLDIDFEDGRITRFIQRATKVAEQTLEGSLGKNYPVEDPRVKEIALCIIADLYDNRNTTTSDKVGAATRRLIEDFSQQVRLEMRDN